MTIETMITPREAVYELIEAEVERRCEEQRYGALKAWSVATLLGWVMAFVILAAACHAHYGHGMWAGWWTR